MESQQLHYLHCQMESQQLRYLHCQMERASALKERVLLDLTSVGNGGDKARGRPRKEPSPSTTLDE
jgi:hypothetical protein